MKSALGFLYHLGIFENGICEYNGISINIF